jgi:hypothetical protein
LINEKLIRSQRSFKEELMDIQAGQVEKEETRT